MSNLRWFKQLGTAFRDRIDAGQQLARQLERFRDQNVIVVGLPRGGVPVAYEVARYLNAPLDVILVRKLGVPFQPEFAMGAIAENGVLVLNRNVVSRARISKSELAAVEASERRELVRRVDRYRANSPRISLSGRVVLVIDDGVATGSTATAACRVVKAEGAVRVVLAVPVAPASWCERLSGSADELISLKAPSRFSDVGQFYSDFGQTTDEDVISYLDKSTGSDRFVV